MKIINSNVKRHKAKVVSGRWSVVSGQFRSLAHSQSLSFVTVSSAVLFLLFLLFAAHVSAEKTEFQVELNNQVLPKAGSVRLIVGVRIPGGFRAEGEMVDETRREQQRAAIFDAQQNLLAQLGIIHVEDVKQFEFIPYLALKTDTAGLEFLKALPDVTSVSEDLEAEPTLAESTAIVGAPAAWATGASGQGWTVAILDTGVEKSHEFLTGKVVSEGCYSTHDPGNGRSSLCPGSVTQTTATNSGLPCSGINSCDHGTHVAGIAAGFNGDGDIDGVAKSADIIAIQIFTRIENCNGGSTPCVRTSSADFIRALERVYALRNTYNIASANMSIGGGLYTSNCDAEFPAIKAAIDNLRSEHIATVVSSGNDSSTDSLAVPACISTAISVGSTSDFSGPGGPVDTVVNSSNSATFLDLLAPGNSIVSSIVGNSYGPKGGTSMAAPHVAGAWAALKDRAPNATVAEVLASLTQTGQPILDTRNNITKPRIQLDAAVRDLRCDHSAVAGTLPFETPLNGFLNASDCLEGLSRRDIYKFNGTGGQQIRVTMQSNLFDSYLYLYDWAGRLIVENDNYGTGEHARILPIGWFALPETGTYYVVAANKAFANTGAYQILLQDNPAATPENGSIAFDSIRDGDYEIFKMNAGGTSETALTNDPSSDRYPIYSPNGSKIAFQSTRDGNSEIYLMNFDGSNPTRLTNNSAIDEPTGFSPDGAKILFQSNRDGNYEIYSMNANGSSPTRLTNNSATDTDAKYSPDGAKIVFRSSRDGNNEIYSMLVSGNVPVRLTNDPANDESPMFSPDGSRIAFHSYRDGNAEIYVMYANGDNERRLTLNPADDLAPIWSPDSSRVVFYADREANQNDIYSIPANGGTASRMTSNAAFDGHPSWQLFMPPTAANVSVSGRVKTADGRGIPNAMLTLTAPDGTGQINRTGPFGYYRFDDVTAGETYILSIATKRFTFANPTVVISVTDELTDIDFVAEALR